MRADTSGARRRRIRRIAMVLTAAAAVGAVIVGALPGYAEVIWGQEIIWGFLTNTP